MSEQKHISEIWKEYKENMKIAFKEAWKAFEKIANDSFNIFKTVLVDFVKGIAIWIKDLITGLFIFIKTVLAAFFLSLGAALEATGLVWLNKIIKWILHL